MAIRILSSTMALAVLLLAVAPAEAAEPAGESAPPPFPTTEFAEGAREASVTDSGITARLFYERRPKIDKTLDVPVLQLTIGNRMVLDVAGLASGMDVPAATASIAEIDPYRVGKEVYFSSYSGGAHCCSRVVVAENGPKGWTTIEIGSFDGDGDYLEDIDNDGVAEIVTTDNAFLYAFDCYACSAAPLVIRAVRDGKVVDVSAETRFGKHHRDWLAELESNAEPETRWSSPGFLAGWVAQSVRAGSGATAYKALLDHWDFSADAGEETCISSDDLDACPKRDRKLLKFPDRLKLFLTRHGYAF
ncbi:hypothetical protein SAMN02745157_1311 [Kaistia soli DSM 19436]|uniref:VCBS repeat-containing protein n=1 Tax=Kaistia soli DSM 19436 TaxID=1122133 RepID=A0A1M4XQR2_9HYPH|nr:hypothetical protein [Kaistia soli]SHE95613.1 hypothetical protein SAMN02745157_1311 [Kaistia soli DSM 19436]